MCLSRKSWAQNDIEIPERDSANDLVTEVEAENQTPFEPVNPSGSPNRGTSLYGDHLLEDVFLITMNKDQAARYNRLVIKITAHDNH